MQPQRQYCPRWVLGLTCANVALRTFYSRGGLNAKPPYHESKRMPKGMIKFTFRIAMIDWLGLLFLFSSLTLGYIMLLCDIWSKVSSVIRLVLSGLSRAHGKRVRSCQVLASRNLHGENSRWGIISRPPQNICVACSIWELMLSIYPPCHSCFSLLKLELRENSTQHS